MASLFCYGTLELEHVIRRLIGRVPESKPATLENYVRLRFKNNDFPGIIPAKRTSVQGTLYQDLTPKEVSALDDYEGSLFKREQVAVCTDGDKVESSWVYVVKRQYHSLLSDKPWSIERYLRFSPDSFLESNG